MLNSFYRAVPFAALAAAWLVFAAPARTRQERVAPSSSNASPLKPCKVAGVDEEVLCGKLSVFENRKTRAGRRIDLNVVVMPALEAGEKEAPLFDLQGGPGIAATAQARWYAGDLREYRRHRDVVLVDLRGTGESNPLACGEYEPTKYLGEMYPVEYLRECRRKLERIADLTQYTTPIAMDDLDDVRAWLGYDKINLVGLSYGTRAALVYMRQHPEHVRAVVLLSVAPTYARLPMYHAPTAQHALSLLLGECETDAACARSYPRVRAELSEVLGRLRRKPARLTYTSPASKRRIPIKLRAEVFAEKLRAQMYEAATARRLPYVIHRAAAGDFAPFLKMAIHDDPSAPSPIPPLADGMYLSVTCAEDVPFIDAREAERVSRDTYFGDYRIREQRRACRLWPRGEVPKNYAAPVDSNAPTLIFSGRLDPVTSPAWGEETAAHLPNGKNVLIPHGAHTPFSLSHVECFDRVTLDFLRRAAVEGLDASCLDTMMPPPFYVEPSPGRD